MSATDSLTVATTPQPPPSMPRLMLAAFRAGMTAGEDPARGRTSNPHTGDGPGDVTLAAKWLDGFNKARGTSRAALQG